ncbi:MAG: chemoreceptor glutamine deamidase CheD [Pseudomonadota bacterium]
MTSDYEEALATNFYFDRNFNTKAVKLLPGEYYVTEREMMLVTVLGSCVAACIRDPLSGLGGMNHFMLPENNGNGSGRWGISARYGSYAMEILINHLLKMGARRNALEAKVFGGGNVLSGMTAANVGERNAAFVLEYLATEKIKVVAQDLVDVYPRKVYFMPQTGKVLVKKLRTIHNDTIFVREQDYGRRITGTRIAGDVELFG